MNKGAADDMEDYTKDEAYDKGYECGYINASRNIFDGLQSLINLAELDSMTLNGEELIHGIRFAVNYIKELKAREQGE